MGVEWGQARHDLRDRARLGSHSERSAVPQHPGLLVTLSPGVSHVSCSATPCPLLAPFLLVL